VGSIPFEISRESLEIQWLQGFCIFGYYIENQEMGTVWVLIIQKTTLKENIIQQKKQGNFSLAFLYSLFCH